MYKNFSFLGLIVARGGSKRLKNKNMYPLLGKPLLEYTYQAAANSKYLDRVIISTEDQNILNFMKKLGCEAPFIRPIDLAKDDTPTIDVVIHALSMIDKKYDYLVLLQPTSPLRTNEDIDKAIEFCINNNAKSVVSFTQLSKPIEWLYIIDANNHLIQLKNAFHIDQNSLPCNSTNQIYIPNGAIYIENIDWLLSKKAFICTQETFPFIMEKHKSIDIDDLLDLYYCETIMSKHINNI